MYASAMKVNVLAKNSSRKTTLCAFLTLHMISYLSNLPGILNLTSDKQQQQYKDGYIDRQKYRAQVVEEVSGVIMHQSKVLVVFLVEILILELEHFLMECVNI